MTTDPVPLACAVASGLCFAAMSPIFMLAARRGCRSMVFSAVFQGIAMVLALPMAIYQGGAWGSGGLWASALLAGLAATAGIAVIVVANSRGPPSVSWTMVTLGIVVPIALAPVLFHERFVALDLVLGALFLGGLLALARGMEGGQGVSGSPWMYAAVVAACFLLNGGQCLAQKLKQAWVGDGSSAAYAVIAYGVGGLVAVGALVVTGRATVPRWAEVSTGALLAVASLGGTLLALAAMGLPAVAVFPIIQGISLLCGVVLTTWLFGECFNRWKTLGVVLALGVVLLAALR